MMQSCSCDKDLSLTETEVGYLCGELEMHKKMIKTQPTAAKEGRDTDVCRVIKVKAKSHPTTEASSRQSTSSAPSVR